MKKLKSLLKKTRKGRLLFLYCAFCFSCNCLYCDAIHVRCSASIFCSISKFCVRSVLIYVSEVTTRKGNESIVPKENCFVEEIKEAELRSRRRNQFIYNRTYNPVGLNKVSHLSRRCRAPSRLPMKKLKSLLKKTQKVRLVVWKGILKNIPLLS